VSADMAALVSVAILFEVCCLLNGIEERLRRLGVQGI
jgi:hypothetical protein